MIRAQDTLELLADLAKVSAYNEFIQVASYRMYATYLVNSSVLNGDTLSTVDKRELKEGTDHLALGIAAVSRQARPYYCDPEMSAVVEASAKVMDSTDITDLTLLPIKYGFCYFAQGIRLSKGMMIHGLLWAEQPGNPENILVYGLNDRLNEADGSQQSWNEYLDEHNFMVVKNSRWIFRFQLSYTAGKPLSPISPEEREEFTAKSREMFKVHTVDLDPRQVFHALLLMLNQEPEVIQISKTEATKKKAARLKEKKLPTEVTVINLRRKYATTGSASGSHEPSDREYSHRWVVSGFWRWQQYKKEKGGEWFHKRIWIDSYVKGPADKPLHVTDKVYALLK